MTITQFLEKWGKTLFEAPIATATRTDEPPELAEVRLAILDQIREKTYRSGGMKVFPYDLIRLEMRGVDEEGQGVFTSRFFRQYLEQEVRGALHNSACRFPDHLRVDVAATVGLPPRDGNWLTVEVASQEKTGIAAHPIGRLAVQEGTANVASLRLDKPRINIGRVVDVYRSEGLFRRNDLAFEGESDVNRSVSREHAHILHDRITGEYRLFNDRWYPRQQPGECGTRIVRDGMSQEVHRTSRGAKLEPGDEIHFGRAIVLFEME